MYGKLFSPVFHSDFGILSKFFYCPINVKNILKFDALSFISIFNLKIGFLSKMILGPFKMDFLPYFFYNNTLGIESI